MRVVTVVVAYTVALALVAVEASRDNARVTDAYGCGRHDAERTARSDPAEYDLPPCVEIRRQWLESETWPKR
jgi:hypothetical protein